jgi:putative serine protease PepD
MAVGPLVAMLAVGALIGGVAGGGVTAAVLAGTQTTVVGTPQGPTAITVNDPDDATLVTGVVATAMPSVVSLQVAGGGTAGGGSGVILSEDGYVLTNNHVATLEGATITPSIRVSLSDGRIFDAELVGSDPLADLAVVKLEGAENLPVIEFADSDALNVGDRAIVIGSPLGLTGTVTNGIVSALNRSITVRSSAVPEQSLEQPLPDNDVDAPFDFWDFDRPGENGTSAPSTPRATISLPVIQTDAAINPGNSGGALLNDQGQLIGIVVALATAGGGSGQAGSIGVGFSIPSNFAQRVADELIADGTASHGLLGATVTDSINDAESTVVGALIDSVTPGGAADVVGLRSGDVITVFNDVPIGGSVDLTAQVRVLAGGDSTTLTYVRGGTAQEVTVTLGELQ